MTALLFAALFTILPPNENKVVAIISREYKLTEEQTALLCAIRRAENGTRYYYGVTDKRCVGYTAQCRWTANTIMLRYDGNIERFARRWCPTNTKVWISNVRFFMRKQGFNK